MKTPGPLVAAFSVKPTAGTSPLAVTFDASGSESADPAILEYHWQFGDGAAATGRVASHTYVVDAKTLFDVRLTVIDEHAREASSQQTVTVYPPIAVEDAVAVGFTWPFHFDASGDDIAHLNDEYFALENTGETAADLTGWRVSNERGVEYVFPSGFRLDPGGIVYIHTGTGEDTTAALYWGASQPVWDNRSDIAILYDARGNIVDIYAYASC